MNTIRQNFINTYGPMALRRLSSNNLAQLLFADRRASVMLGTRGMFTWIEHGDPDNGVPIGTFGRCGVISNYGILLDDTCTYKKYPKGSDHTVIPITQAEAIAYAVEVRSLILQINKVIKVATLNTVADYINLHDKIARISLSHTSNLYWNNQGNLSIYLLKYFHILYPDKIFFVYSDSKLDRLLNKFGIRVPESLPRLVKNGILLLLFKGLIARTYSKVNGNATGELSSNVDDCSSGKPYPDNILKVTADCNGKIYLRSYSTGDYTGKGWLSANVYSAATPYNAYFLTHDALQSYGVNSNNVTVMLGKGVRRYFYPCFAGSNKGNAAVNDVVIDGAVGANGIYSQPVILDHSAVSRISVPARLSSVEHNYRNFVYAHYLNVFASTSAAIHSEISSGRLNVSHWNGTRGHLFDLIGSVCMYFADNYKYSYDCIIPVSEPDNVAYFLNGGTGRKGVCRHFAAASTLIFRELGIAARFVVGYHSRVKKNKTVQVTSENAHAWVEVYVDDLGWIIVDPTPSLGNNNCDRNYDDDEYYYDDDCNDSVESYECDERYLEDLFGLGDYIREDLNYRVVIDRYNRESEE